MERTIKAEPILAKKNKDKGWEFIPCPFCGHTDIGVKDTIIDVKAGHDCPSSAIRRIWAYCRYCGAEGPKTTNDIVYDDEEIAAAIVSWNKREEETNNKEPRWIPVSERLPNTDDEVLCWYEYYHWSQEKVLPEYGLGRYFRETSAWFGEVANGKDVRVIAWMPLPKPYEPQESEDRE